MADYAEKMNRNSPLHGMFTAIPHRYDLVNHVITWGLDKRWRDKAARECLTSQPEKVLDLCCGTGDLVINIARLAENGVELTGVDYSQPLFAGGLVGSWFLRRDSKFSPKPLCRRTVTVNEK